MYIENELLKNLDGEEIIDRFLRAKCRKKPNVKLISEVDMGMYYVSVKVHSESDIYICVKYFRAVKRCNSECK